MNTFYTIIKVAPNALSGDALSVGLLLHDGEKLWLQFSDERRAVAKRLLQDKHDVIDFLTKQVQQKVAEMNALLAYGKVQLFDLQHLISSEKFTFLSTYSNGIIRFDTPVFLNDRVDEEKFQKLFRLLIDASPEISKAPDESRATLRATVQRKLVDKVAGKVHTNLELTPAILPGIYYNFHIDCLGKNGSLIGAKAISFEVNYQTWDKELSHYFSLISLLDKQEKRKYEADCFYILCEEPAAIKSREHRAWESLHKNPVVNLLHPEDADQVAEQVLRKNATTFLSVP